jgi:ABC-type sugar transport system, periplasmic component
MLACFMLVSLAACGTGTNTSDDTANNVTNAATTSTESAAKPQEEIKLSAWLANAVTAEELKASQDTWYITKCINRFEQENPGTKVEITIQSDGIQTLQTFKASAAANNGPDIVEFFSGPTFLSVKEALLPLNKYIPQEDKDALIGWEAVSEDMDSSKTIYAYPYPGQSVVGLAYNKELVKSAGLDFETNPPRSIEAFDDALAKIKAAGFLPFNSDESQPIILYYVLDFWWSQKTGLTNILAKTNGTAKFADDQGLLDMLAKYQSYYQKGYINKDAATSADSANKFLQGKCVLYPFGNWDVDSFSKALGDKFGIMCPPSTTKEGESRNGAIGGVGAALAVANYTKHPEMAVKFISHMMKRDELIEYYKGYPTVPHRKDITAEDIGKTSDPIFSKLISWKDDISYWPDNCLSSEAGAVYQKFACQVLVGNMTPKELAKKMDEAQAQ